MTFADVVNDLQSLVGVKINSIRPGASVTLTYVSAKEGRLTLTNAQGGSQERSLKELARVWQALVTQPAIRVEDVLQGSGSSRNQPETILANLPYVEWAKIDNKKHIAFVGDPTHKIGTLKQMGAIRASTIKKALCAPVIDKHVAAIVFTKDLNATSATLSELLGVQPKAVSMGVYKFVPTHGHQIFMTLAIR